LVRNLHLAVGTNEAETLSGRGKNLTGLEKSLRPAGIDRGEFRQIDHDSEFRGRDNGLSDSIGHFRIQISDQPHEQAIGSPISTYGESHRYRHVTRLDQLDQNWTPWYA
jgi:hypothetical protein